MANLMPWRKQKDSPESFGGLDFPLSRLRNEFDALFDNFFGRWPSLHPSEWGMQPVWGFDIDDTGKEIVVRAEAPGFEPNDFDIRITGNTLTIQAEKKQESKEKKGETFFSQRRLQRSITLPADVEADNVNCSYKNGILELHLPRTQKAEPKRIEVKA